MYFPPLVWDDFYQCLQLIFWVVWHRAAKCNCGLFLFFFFYSTLQPSRPVKYLRFHCSFSNIEAGKEGEKKEGGRETEDDTGRWGVAALTLSSTFKWDFSQTQETGKSNLEPEEPAHHVLWISRGDVLQSFDCGVFASCSLPYCLIFVSAVRTKNFPSPAEVVLL